MPGIVKNHSIPNNQSTLDCLKKSNELIEYTDDLIRRLEKAINRRAIALPVIDRTHPLNDLNFQATPLESTGESAVIMHVFSCSQNKGWPA